MEIAAWINSGLALVIASLNRQIIFRHENWNCYETLKIVLLLSTATIPVFSSGLTFWLSQVFIFDHKS